MSKIKTWYITTPIYYVNGSPHVGSALTTVCCDVLARYHRMRGEKTWFLTGTDEQATKVFEAAGNARVAPQEFVDHLAGEFKDAWKKLHISNDDFIRTTEPRHIEVVQEVFRRLRQSGDIYPGMYEGWYCVSDETFFRDTDVQVDHLCPNPECRKPLSRVQEESYFFRLSAYGDKLLELIQGQPDMLQPEFRRNEVVSFIQQGLRDMSVTRSNPGWGIPVPGEPDKVIYVWFDALINYLAATGWPNDTVKYEELWPADVHLMAKEIFVRFHATLWPAVLMALGLPAPRQVYAHGWWVGATGIKEGKRTGGLPHPTDFSQEIANQSGASIDISADALRYLLLREMQFHGDTEFSGENLLRRYNTDLANDLGNFTNRAVNMVSRYFAGSVPSRTIVDSDIVDLGREVVEDYEKALTEYRFNGALEAVWRLVARMNKYVEEKTPWKLAKQGDMETLSMVLYTCLEAVRVIATMLKPVMPFASESLYAQIGLDSVRVEWKDARIWGLLPAGTKLPAPQPIFPRIDLSGQADSEGVVQPSQKPIAVKKEKNVSEEPKAVAPVILEDQTAPAVSEYITIEDVMKVQLKVANIVAAESVPNATKLLKLTVEVAEETRTVLAGIAEMYQPEELVGKQVVLVANLQPRKMRGVESQGMLLAADVDGQAILLQPETKVPSGSPIR